MIKTPGTEFVLPLRNSAVGTLFRIVSGEISSIGKGDTFRIQIPVLVRGRAIINLNGQKVTVEAVPKPLEGKFVTLRLTNSGSLPALEIVNPVKNSSAQYNQALKKEAIAQNLNVAPKAAPLVETKSDPRTIAGKGDSGLIQSAVIKDLPVRRATLISPAGTTLKNSGEFQVIVTQTSGKKALLTAIPATAPVAESKAKVVAAKTAHDVAYLKLPLTLLKQGKAEPVEIRIDNLSSPLKKGEQLLVEIKGGSITKNPELLLKTAERPVSQPILSTKADFPLATPDNRLLAARVEQRLPNGNITFQWQGESFEARAPSTVKAGDMLLLKSIQGTKTPSLEVIDLVKNLPERAINLFKERVAMSEPLSQVLRNLTQPSSPAAVSERALPPPVTTQLGALTTLLESYTVTDNRPLDGNRLATMIRNSGQLYEALLGKELQSGDRTPPLTSGKDMKEILLKLFEVAQSADKSARAIRILQASEHGAARIESQQAINLLAFQQAEPIRIEFPLIIQGMLSAVQMAISMEMQTDHEMNPEDEASSSDAFNILFALELSQLGSVKVDARITSGSVHATIYSEKSEARHLFQEHISRLTERLQALGFKDIQLSTSSGSELLDEKKESFSCLELGLPISKGLLDVTG